MNNKIRALIIAGVVLIMIAFLVVKPKNNGEDATLNSRYSETRYVLKGVAKRVIAENKNYLTRFQLKHPDKFYKNYIKDHEEYVYSVDKQNKKSSGDTGRYLMKKDNRLYFIDMDTKDKGTMYELCCSIIVDNRYLHVILPYYGELSGEETNILPEDTLLGAPADFSELKEFYSTLMFGKGGMSDMAEFEEGSKTIRLSAWNGTKWVEDCVLLKVAEGEIQVSVTDAGRAAVAH